MTKEKQANTGDRATAAALRDIRLQLGDPSQKALSREMGLGDTYVWYIETEQRGMTIRAAKQIAEFAAPRVGRTVAQVFLELAGLAKNGVIMEGTGTAPVELADLPLIQAIEEAKANDPQPEPEAQPDPEAEGRAIIEELAADGLTAWVWEGVGVSKGKTFATAQKSKTAVQKISGLGWSTFYAKAREVRADELNALQGAKLARQGVALQDEAGRFYIPD